MRTILFICTGNTCRSPMAEGIARALIEKGAFGETNGEIFVASAGLDASEGAPTTPETVEALRALEIEYDGHATVLSRRMIEKADLILCMTASHAASVRRMVDDDPDQVAKISTLDPDRDIPDPIGLDQSVYDALARDMNRILARRLEELLQK